MPIVAAYNFRDPESFPATKTDLYHRLGYPGPSFIPNFDDGAGRPVLVTALSPRATLLEATLPYYVVGVPSGSIRMSMMYTATTDSIWADMRCMIQSRTLGGFYQLRVLQSGGRVTLQLGATRPNTWGLGRIAAHYFVPFRTNATVAMSGMDYGDLFSVDFAWSISPTDLSEPPVVILTGSCGPTVADLTGFVQESVDFGDFPTPIVGTVPPFNPTWEQKWSIFPGTLYTLGPPVTEQTLFFCNVESQICYAYKVTVQGALIAYEQFEPPIMTPELFYYEQWEIEPPKHRSDRRSLTAFR